MASEEPPPPPPPVPPPAPKRKIVPRRQRPGPTDISDPMLRQEARRAVVWIGIAAMFALVILLAQPLLVIFAGMVFAAMVDEIHHPLRYHTASANARQVLRDIASA